MAYDLEHEYTPLERLRLIAEAVGSVPNRKINLAVWSNECGTTACAIGWGVIKFGKQIKMGLERDGTGKVWQLTIDGETPNTWKGIADHLGIGEVDAIRLFRGGTSIYQKDGDPSLPTAARIKEVILEVADRYERAAAG